MYVSSDPGGDDRRERADTADTPSLPPSTRELGPYRHIGRGAPAAMRVAAHRSSMAADGAEGGGAGDLGPRIGFRCHGCGVRFAGDAGGPGTCPRCGAIGGHERLGRVDDAGW
jgi:rubrerythrin